MASAIVRGAAALEGGGGLARDEVNAPVNTTKAGCPDMPDT
jgi:hypothetical protein